MISFLEKFILDNWRKYFPDQERPNQLSSLLLRGYRIRHKVVLFFPDQSRFPVLAAKILRKPENLPRLEKEFETLERIRNILSKDLGKTIPKGLVLRKFNEDFILIETALKGKTMHRTMMGGGEFLYRRRMRQSFSVALDWLIRFHRETMDLKSSFSNGSDSDRLDMIVDNFTRAYGTRANEKMFSLHLQEKIEHLKHTQIPRVWQHGDFWSLNILVDERSNIGVVDWEFSNPSEIPFWDLFHFLTSAGVHSRNASWGRDWTEGFRDAFISKNWLSHLVLESINRYCQELNIDRSLAQACLPLFLMKMSTREFETSRKHELFDTRWRHLLDIYLENEESAILPKGNK